MGFSRILGKLKLKIDYVSSCPQLLCLNRHNPEYGTRGFAAKKQENHRAWENLSAKRREANEYAGPQIRGPAQGGKAIFSELKIADFPETLDHTPKSSCGRSIAYAGTI